MAAFEPFGLHLGYVSILIDFLTKTGVCCFNGGCSDVVRLAIAQLLPGDNLSSLVPVMERFLVRVGTLLVLDLCTGFRCSCNPFSVKCTYYWPSFDSD